MDNELDEDTPRPLHTIADNDPPLSAREAEAMGFQRPRAFGNVKPIDEVVYGEGDGFENEDQADANHAEPDEHL